LNQTNKLQNNWNTTPGRHVKAGDAVYDQSIRDRFSQQDAAAAAVIKARCELIAVRVEQAKKAGRKTKDVSLVSRIFRNFIMLMDTVHSGTRSPTMSGKLSSLPPVA
jgi:hypothetical protein